MKKCPAILFLLLLAATAASALTLTATWVEGGVERRVGSAWRAISIGDAVDSSDTIRLGPGALAEFTGGLRRISLSAPGIYVLDALAKAGAERSKSSASAMDKFGKLVDPKSSAIMNQSTVAGVRGDPVSEAGAAWLTDEDDPATLAEDGKSAARDGKYAEAAALFGKAAEGSEGEEKAGYEFAKAWAFAAEGSSIEAIKTLRGMGAAGGEWGRARALLLARLDLDTGSAAEAKAILEAAVAAGGLSPEDLELAKSMLEEARR
jgi:hypothetical protein